MAQNEIVDKILDSVDIVDVISTKINVKRTGRNYKANCPFHNEKTPSFVVSPDKQIFHCFGCGVGGNVISFLMKYENISFMETLELLAEKTGIQLPKSKTSPKENKILDVYFAINKAAKELYQAFINTPQAMVTRRYLTDRDVNEESIKHFQLGYSQNSWDELLNFFTCKKIQSHVLEKLGLIISRKENSGFYDRFRNRLVFPIFDIRNRVIGFGARALNDENPKYINSPDTPVYQKGRHFYGLNFTKDHIKKMNYAIVVEGYMDLIIPYQFGIKNLVATCGTALTPQQIKLLKRYTNTVVVLFDSDTAGEEASLRGMDLLISMEMNVRVATLPKGYDPDTFVREKGAVAFDSQIKASKDLFDYKLDLLNNRYDKSKVKGKAAIATLMLPTIARIPNEILKSSYLKKLSDILAIDIEALKKEILKVKRDYSHKVEVNEPKRVNRRAKKAELYLLSIIFNDIDLLTFFNDQLGVEYISDEGLRAIFEKLQTLYEQGKEIKVSKLFSHFSDERTMALISASVAAYETIVDKEKTLSDCIKDIKKKKTEEDMHFLKEQVNIAHQNNDMNKSKELMQKYNELLTQIRK